MANHSSEEFILDNNFHKSTNYAALLDIENLKLEDKASVHPEGSVTKNQEQITTKKLVTQKLYDNNIHVKISNTRE